VVRYSNYVGSQRWVNNLLPELSTALAESGILQHVAFFG
jgi:hypothetical protein